LNVSNLIHKNLKYYEYSALYYGLSNVYDCLKDTVIELFLRYGVSSIVFTSLLCLFYLSFYSPVSHLAFRLPFLINLSYTELNLTSVDAEDRDEWRKRTRVSV